MTTHRSLKERETMVQLGAKTLRMRRSAEYFFSLLTVKNSVVVAVHFVSVNIA